MRLRHVLLLLFFFVAAAAPAQTAPDPVADIARRTIAGYENADRDTYLDNLFRLQLADARFADAKQTLAALHALRASRASGPSPSALVVYEVYAEAKGREMRDHVTFEDALGGAFRDVVGALDDRAVANPVRWALGTSPVRLEQDAQAALAKGADSEATSIDLVRKAIAARAYRALWGRSSAFLDEDDRRRYIIENHLVRTSDGAQVCTLVVRPRAATKTLPALLNFTIYSGPEQPLFEARRSASNGYVGVEGFTRGKACSPDTPVPIEHDGADAATVIVWIAKQPWSDGRVGMYGGSYEGFTQWAAAKHMPKALKAMMPSVTFAPAIDFPMEGNVFVTYAFPWPFYTTNSKALDDATYDDTARWNKLKRAWYVSGRPYRELDAIDGTPNPWFNRWIAHPTYDAYWHSMIPVGKEFARIDIPVLTTTGYYDGGQIGALHYFAQHHRYRPGAEHYVVIGPYSHISGQRGTLSPLGRAFDDLRGYKIDPIANMDIGELRYEWFNYVFKGAPKPALLKDAVNYEVMGSNVWKHAPSLAAMAGHDLRLHITTDHRLVTTRPKRRFVTQTVDLADRSDVDRFFNGEFLDQSDEDAPIVSRSPRVANAMEFVSEPLPAGTEISGLFSGQLELITNKKDFDFSVMLFELTPNGEYMQLSSFWSRASHVRDHSHRTLLVPGRRTRLPFTSGRVTSRKFRPGSRLAVVINVLKEPFQQINYGTGKDVSDESIADAGERLNIQWSTGTFLDIPIGR